MHRENQEDGAGDRNVRGEPELADSGDHRAEHHHVEHEGADDGHQLDAVHPVRRRGRVARRHPVENEGEDDQQERVEDADEVAVEGVAEPGRGVDDCGACQHQGEQRREEHRQHRRHVLHDPLLRLDEPGGHDHGACGSRRQHPFGDPLDVDPGRLEDRSGQAHQHAAPERDQDVVDEPLAREADEVHPPLVRSHGAAHVRIGGHEPQHDGEMERDKDFGRRVLAPRIQVDHERSERERCRRQRPSSRVEPAAVGEVRGQERQHEEACVPHQPRRFLVGCLSGEACNLDDNGCGHCEDERLDPTARRARRLVLTAREELLPQSAAVLAGELPRQAVDVSEPFHGDQEALVGSEAGRVQLGDLVTKMVFQLVDVAAVDARGARDVRTPLRDLSLERCHDYASPPAVSITPEPGQTSLSARVTAAHCRCCSASAARPSSVRA